MSEITTLSYEDAEKYEAELNMAVPDACLNHSGDDWEYMCDRKEGHEGPHADLIKAKEWK